MSFHKNSPAMTYVNTCTALILPIFPIQLPTIKVVDLHSPSHGISNGYGSQSYMHAEPLAKKRKRDKKENDDNTDKQNQPKQRQRIDTEIQVHGSIIRNTDLRRGTI